MEDPLVVFTDTDEAGVGVGAALLEEAGFRVRIADCHTEEDVIRAGRGAVALLPLMAPVGRRVFEALPDVRLVATNTVGFDSIDVDAAAQRGVWVAVIHFNWGCALRDLARVCDGGSARDRRARDRGRRPPRVR